MASGGVIPKMKSSNCGKLSKTDERKCLRRAKRFVLRQYPWAGYWLAAADLPQIEYVWTIRNLTNRRVLVSGYFNQETDTAIIAMKYGTKGAKYILAHELTHWLYWCLGGSRTRFDTHRADAKLDHHPRRGRTEWETPSEVESEDNVWHTHYSRP